METLLRQCYKELGIKNANAVIFNSRKTSIQKILEDSLLDDDELKSLLNWILGIEDEESEKVLVRLEEIFCEEDVNFSIDDKKEIQILCEILIYQYCIDTEDTWMLLMIICGYNAGYKIKSDILFKLFEYQLDEKRLMERKNLRKKAALEFKKVKNLAKDITANIKIAEDEGNQFEYTSAEFNGFLEVLEEYKDNFARMEQSEIYLLNELDIQREESDILWWVINEWSEVYKKSYRDLKCIEAAVSAPIELKRLIKRDLGPYAAKQMLYKMISLPETENHKFTITNIVQNANEELLNMIDFDNMQIEIVQPILFSLQCKYECRKRTEDNAWKVLFENKTCKCPDEISMNAPELASRLYFELELAGLSD